MTNAMEKVRETGVPIKTAARQFGLPESSLRHKLSGRVDPKATRSGPSPFCPWKKNTTLFSTLSLCLNAAMATAEQRWLTWQHHMPSALTREIRITL